MVRKGLILHTPKRMSMATLTLALEAVAKVAEPEHHRERDDSDQLVTVIRSQGTHTRCKISSSNAGNPNAQLISTIIASATTSAII